MLEKSQEIIFLLLKKMGAVNSDASDKVETLQGISAVATAYQTVSAVKNGATLAKVDNPKWYEVIKTL